MQNKCSSCEVELAAGQTTCPYCGTVQPQTNQSPNPAAIPVVSAAVNSVSNASRTPVGAPKTGLAIASLIVGAVSPLVFIVLGAAPIAVIPGIFAIVRASKNPAEYGGKTYAATGIVLGILGIVVVAVLKLIDMGFDR